MASRSQLALINKDVRHELRLVNFSFKFIVAVCNKIFLDSFSATWSKKKSKNGQRLKSLVGGGELGSCPVGTGILPRGGGGED